MSPELWFVIHVFAVYRLSELIANDQIFDWVRQETAKRAATGKKIWIWVADWIHCPLCIGVWLSFPVALLFSYLVDELQYIIIIWLGISGAQYILSCLTPERE